MHMSFATFSLIDSLVNIFEETINQNFPKALNLDDNFITIGDCILTKECKYIKRNRDGALYKLVNEPIPNEIMTKCLHPCGTCSSFCQSKHQ